MINKYVKLWQQFNKKQLSIELILETFIGKLPIIKDMVVFLRDKLYADQAMLYHLYSSSQDDIILRNYLEHLVFPSYDTKAIAIRKCPHFIDIFEYDYELFKIGYQKDKNIIRFMKYHPPEVQYHVLYDMAPLSANKPYIDYLKITELDIAEKLIQYNTSYIRVIPENLQTDDLVWKVLEHRPDYIEYIHNPSEEMKDYAINNNSSNIKKIKYTSVEQQLRVVKKFPLYFNDIKNVHDETCMYIIENIEEIIEKSSNTWQFKLLMRYAIDKASNETTKIYGTMKLGSLFL